MKIYLWFVAILACLSFSAQAQLILSEIAPTNTGQVADQDNDHPDWIEIFNSGSTVQNLKGISLSDNAEPRWTFPQDTLSAGERLLVFASGKNRNGINEPGINHWETAVNESDLWKTFIGTEAPPANWADASFDDSAWTNGHGGFGYGDDDDITQVPEGSISFYYREKFNVADISKLDSAILSMDYDDGFIAYLNGTEIARSGNMPPGTDYTTLTTADHEAMLYSGGVPETFAISRSKLNSVLVQGENVLAIELHNVEPTSSDLSGRTWLHFGIASSQVFYGPNPSFFTVMGVGSAGYYHTNFKISFGETIRLFDADGKQLDSAKISYLQPGHSFMRISDVGDWCFTNHPTPDAPNDSGCFSKYADAPLISPAAGLYQSQLTATIAGTNIRYTLDGSEPVDTSTLYTDPITVSANTVLRARSFDPGLLPGNTTTATYLIGETTQLPVLSITAKPGDLFDDGSGGLAAYDNYNSGLKAPVQLEYFDKDRNLAFSEKASMKPVGGYSIAFDQKSMQFEFDEEYGALDDVHYPIFEKDKPGITKYHAFRVRNMDDDWSSTRMRDVIANRMALPTHCAVGAYQHMAVFINGQYWGHYGGREALNKYYVRDNHGSNPDQVDEIFTSYFEQNKYLPDEGTDVEFFSMTDFILNHDMRDSVNFAAAQKRVDLENWVDYFADEIYIANGDWFSSMYFNNLRIYRAPDLRWRYLLFDETFSQNNNVNAATNILDEALAHPAFRNLYTDMMDSLLMNPGFKNYFINRFADLMNEYWKTSKILALIDENIIELSPEIGHQSQRWGSAGSLDWVNAVSYLKSFHRDRPEYQRQQIQDFFGLNAQVEITLQVQPTGAGVVKISTIVPKTYPWKGIYYDGNPVAITAIPNAGFKFDHWSSSITIDSMSSAIQLNITADNIFTAHFTGSAQPLAIELSEINYQSDPTTDAGDWFELKNNANYPIDISNYKVQDRDWYHQYFAPAGTVIQPHQQFVVVGDNEKFSAIHPDVLNKTGGTGFGLDNDSDQIRLFDRDGNPVIDATYSDKKPWPCTPGGFGRTLERLSDFTDANLPESWFDGCMGGSPGTSFSPCADDLIISEINYNSAAGADAGDWVELKNQTESAIDLSGWNLRDDNDEHNFRIPAGITIPPGEYFVFCENVSAFNTQYPLITNKIGDMGFAFGNKGDGVRLYDADTILQLSFCYDNKLPWNTSASGEGYTLELADANGNLNDPFNWFAGCLGGSPGGPYDPNCTLSAVPITPVSELLVYPNPIDDQVIIKFGETNLADIRLTDIWGKVLQEKKVTSDKAVFSTELLAPGIYFMVVTIGKKRMVRKMFKL
ncbi:MAG: lamin tail domain-containing protein [Saprospiraceae bacterium]